MTWLLGHSIPSVHFQFEFSRFCRSETQATYLYPAQFNQSNNSGRNTWFSLVALMCQNILIDSFHPCRARQLSAGTNWWVIDGLERNLSVYFLTWPTIDHYDYRISLASLAQFFVIWVPCRSHLWSPLVASASNPQHVPRCDPPSQT